jgi:hypothetical protein
LLRYSFFVDCDFARAAQTVTALKSASPDPHRELIEGVLGFVASDQFVMF